MILRFGRCELDESRVVLRRDGTEVHVEPQVWNVRRLLIAHRGTVVLKEQLLDEVWGSRFVSESALTTRIKAVRQAVGDDGSTQEIIRTGTVMATSSWLPSPRVTTGPGPRVVARRRVEPSPWRSRR
jgi:DNA-binding response OmpR family regulator